MEGREPLSRRMWGRRPGRPGECPPNLPIPIWSAGQARSAWATG